MRDTCTESLYLILWQRSEHKQVKKYQQTQEVVEKPFYKCISEGLMHVAAWYHGTQDQSSRNSGNKFRLATLLTLPNLIALR